MFRLPAGAGLFFILDGSCECSCPVHRGCGVLSGRHCGYFHGRSTAVSRQFDFKLLRVAIEFRWRMICHRGNTEHCRAIVSPLSCVEAVNFQEPILEDLESGVSLLRCGVLRWRYSLEVDINTSFMNASIVSLWFAVCFTSREYATWKSSKSACCY